MRWTKIALVWYRAAATEVTDHFCGGLRELLSAGQPRRLSLHVAVLLQETLDKSCVKLPSPEIRIRKNLAVQRNRRINALDDEHLQRPRHARDRFSAVFAADYQFC